MWERGKNRLSLTSQRIREAFSPPGSPEPGMSAYYNNGELSSDTDSDGGRNGELYKGIDENVEEDVNDTVARKS